MWYLVGSCLILECRSWCVLCSFWFRLLLLIVLMIIWLFSFLGVWMLMDRFG